GVSWPRGGTPARGPRRAGREGVCRKRRGTACSRRGTDAGARPCRSSSVRPAAPFWHVDFIPVIVGGPLRPVRDDPMPVTMAVLLVLFVLSPADARGPEDDPHAGHAMGVPGRLGPYPASRESSGTSWQPQSTPMSGVHFMKGRWMLMVHAAVDAVYDHQGGPRGDDAVYGPTMGMLMAQRSLGSGTLGLRAMLSLDPATVGHDGYPLLFQTGETADGQTPLIARKHPHALSRELPASYSIPVAREGAVFLYFGMPGEPALGPPTFMHRFSGMPLPEAPLTHHWLDSTHITFGVATAGV